MITSKECCEHLETAEMITANADEGRALRLMSAVALEQRADNVESACMYATAHGIYEAWVNGVSVDDSVMNPGWTAYEWRLQVKCVDITEHVRSGNGNVAVEVLLGNGWYRGKFGFERQRSDYGDTIGFIGAIEVRYKDGAMQRIVTTPAWRAYASRVVYNNLYNGETIDARINEADEQLVVGTVEFDRSTLIAQECPLVKRFEIFHPQRIWTSPTGKMLVDFGQNLVGWIRFSVCGPAGAKIVIRHAEVIEDGELGVRPLREARATDTYFLSGGKDSFEPTLTFHGFRYAEITGWPTELTSESLEAVAIRSEIRKTGSFTCSNVDINQLVSNSMWSQRGNFLDIPTDCPQRDEREGWTGDIAAYAPTACFQFDCSMFLHKWLMDLRAEAENSPIGVVPMVVPDIVKLKCPDNVKEWVKNETAIWGDASVWVPQALWNAYGDKQALAEHYPGMCLHLSKVESDLSSEGLWDSGFQFGDWLDPVAPPDDPADAKADKYVIAQACLYRSASFAAEAADVLGRSEDARHWRELAERVKQAFNSAYVENGIVKSDAISVYSLAIHFGLLDGANRDRAAARLVELVREADYKVMTGFAGTPYTTWALSETGHADVAYQMLLEKGCPSWLYPVSMGATTIWERWDSMLPNGKINPGGMTSFNHYALGAVCDWIYQVVAGIRPAKPGYSKVRIEPVPGEGVDWVECSLESVRGQISVSWKLTEGSFNLEVVVPDSVDATVVLPNGSRYEVGAGTHRFGCTLV